MMDTSEDILFSSPSKNNILFVMKDQRLTELVSELITWVATAGTKYCILFDYPDVQAEPST